MPIARYFLHVGGALLVLLWIADWYLPKLPEAESVDSVPPSIRIHSERKWPERVVYDTSLQIVMAPPPGSQADTERDVSGGVRQAFAQVQPADASKAQPAEQKKTDAKPQRQRKVARKHMPMYLVSRQPPYGWFGPRIW